MNGEEALTIIDAQRKNPFDIIFLDIHMPILDGPGTVLALRDR